ncbi:unnamed protein product [Prorocentrum cordatum]|uniref:Uncharacterized protein n=1 Tax=Prorocentrum cordatum TaxID=2364126 RepID=A0ABN9TXE5_9DINO|nr:unnamed protein product [Polarella glacialis]
MIGQVAAKEHFEQPEECIKKLAKQFAIDGDAEKFELAKQEQIKRQGGHGKKDEKSSSQSEETKAAAATKGTKGAKKTSEPKAVIPTAKATPMSKRTKKNKASGGVAALNSDLDGRRCTPVALRLGVKGIGLANQGWEMGEEWVERSATRKVDEKQVAGVKDQRTESNDQRGQHGEGDGAWARANAAEGHACSHVGSSMPRLQPLGDKWADIRQFVQRVPMEEVGCAVAGNVAWGSKVARAPKRHRVRGKASSTRSPASSSPAQSMAELTPGTRRMHEKMGEWMGLEGSLLGGGRLPPTDDEAQKAERSKVAGDAEEEQADEADEEKADEVEGGKADEVQEVPIMDRNMRARMSRQHLGRLGESSESHLISAIDSETKAINDEMGSHPNPDERAMERASIRPGQFFHCGLIKKLTALKKADPTWSDNEDHDESPDDDTNAHLSKKGRGEQRFYEETAAKNFMFTTTEDKRICEYVTLERLAWLKGGGTAGLRLALQHASNAVLMGGKWVRWDDMAETIEFLNDKHQLTESFKKSWHRHKEWARTFQGSEAGSSSASALPAPDAVEAAPTTRITQRRDKGEEDHGSTGHKKGIDNIALHDEEAAEKFTRREQEKPMGEEKVSKVNPDLVKFRALKSNYDWAISHYAKLDGLIKSKDTSWKAVGKFREPMGTAMQVVNAKCSEHGLMSMMALAEGKFKKQVGDKEFETCAQRANVTLTKSVTILSSEVRILMNQKLARDDEDERLRLAANPKDKKGSAKKRKKDHKEVTDTAEVMMEAAEAMCCGSGASAEEANAWPCDTLEIDADSHCWGSDPNADTVDFGVLLPIRRPSQWGICAACTMMVKEELKQAKLEEVKKVAEVHEMMQVKVEEDQDLEPEVEEEPKSEEEAGQQQGSREDGPRIPRTPERKPANATLNTEDEFEELSGEDPSKIQGRNAAILAARAGDWSKTYKACSSEAAAVVSAAEGRWLVMELELVGQGLDGIPLVELVAVEAEEEEVKRPRP